MIVDVVFPVAKEGSSLYDRILVFDREFSKWAKRLGFTYRYTFVSDVPHPETLAAMRRLAKVLPATPLYLTRRLGKGGSVKNAVAYTSGDYVVLLDADTPVEPRIVAEAVVYARLKGLDLLVARRVYRSHSLGRRVLSAAYNGLVNLFFRTGLSDHQAGFKILSRRAALVVLVGSTRTDGFAYDTELIVWSRYHGLRVGSIDVVWEEKREGSTIPPFRALLTMLADLVMLRLLSGARKYPALRRIRVGRVIDIREWGVVGPEFMTVIDARGFKKRLLAFLRRLYVAVAFRR